MKKGQLKGILAFAMVCGLALAACDNGAQPVAIEGVKAPSVKGEPIDVGVKLWWDYNREVIHYDIFRKGPDKDDLSLYIGSTDADWGLADDGKIYYYDIAQYVSRDRATVENELASGTQYTYTVYARAVDGLVASGKSGDVKVTTGTLKEKGSKLEAPAGASLAFDADKGEITVTINPPAAAAGTFRGYWVEVSGPNSYSNQNWTSTDTLTLGWDNYYQEAGEYEVRVTTSFGSSGDYHYYEDSDVVSAKSTYSRLFGGGGLSVSGGFDYTGTDPYTLSHFRVRISSLGLQRGVSYAYQRASVDELGNITGAWADFAATKEVATTAAGGLTTYSYEAITAADIEFDVLGKIPLSAVYDNTISGVAVQRYKYRIAGTKDGATEYREQYGYVTLDPREEIGGTLNVVRTTDPTNYVFSFTPSIDYLNAMQDGDRIEVYSVYGASNAYTTGPWHKEFEFSKAEIEALAPVAKTISQPTSGTSNYLYVHARLVFADANGVAESGWQNVAQYDSFSWSGNGLSGYNSGYTNDDEGRQVYYTMLNY